MKIKILVLHTYIESFITWVFSYLYAIIVNKNLLQKLYNNIKIELIFTRKIGGEINIKVTL